MKITKKGSGQELDLHEHSALGPCFLLTENYPYLAETKEGELSHPAATPLRPGLYELVFKNFVGWAKLGDTLLKIRTPKLSDDGFDAMVNQITEVCASLPFAFNTPSFLPFERISPGGEEVLYHAFMYLRYMLKDSEPSLEAVLNRIIANPHRVIVREAVRQELHRARRVRPASINRLASCPRDLINTRQAPHLSDCEISRRLEDISGERYFPTYIQGIKKDASIDNPENRFVKHFLEQCLLIAELFRRCFRDKAQEGGYFDHGLLEDAHLMVNNLKGLLTRGFFADVGEMAYLPYNSQVLQKGPGYRELFSFFNRMNMGSAYPIGSADLRKIIENKDVALLYEYWTYFKCVDVLSEVVGKPKRAIVKGGREKEKEKTLPYDLGVDFGGGISLFYNKTYHGNRRGSYSLAYRPDIALEMPDGIYIFDAKFKKERVIFEQFEGEEVAETKEEEFDQGFKYGDINKMHCYRDAIQGVKAAFILYPGDLFRFFHVDKGKMTAPQQADDLNGVGAIPLRPSTKGSDTKDLKSVLELCCLGDKR